jgi:uncharacterized protein YcfJ
MDEGVVGAVVSSIVIGGETWRGASNGTKIVISASAVKGSTLAHEVGHIAKNADLYPTITMRIMNKTTGGDENRVNCNERDKYLALK